MNPSTPVSGGRSAGVKTRALILAGDGINCERETAQAFQTAGFDAEIHHINDLIREGWSTDTLASRYRVVALPGGFSFGDHLTSGKILALKIQHGLKWDFAHYASKGGLVLGVCNGFQTLIRGGVFGRTLSITSNTSGKFLNQWVTVAPTGTRSVWLKGMGSVTLPVRHGEGRVVFAQNSRIETLTKMERQGMMCLKYDITPNGSQENLAGLCDPTGRILGLMPHPEAFLRWTAHPNWTAQPGRAAAPGEGLKFFENAYAEARASS